MTSFTVVIPTIGRPSLVALLERLASDITGPPPAGIVVVDDSRSGARVPEDLSEFGARVLRSGGGGPARARNVGWRAATTDWVAFLDDDVLPSPGWYGQLAADLADLPPEVAGSQGRVHVPLPASRRPTDWERSTAGLEQAEWITADMAYRRDALAAVGGFDERFPRAFREDSDLALRVLSTGRRLVHGSRVVQHPVRPVGWWTSLRQQAGNADDMLMRRVHGPGWYDRARADRGRRLRHVIVTAAGLAAVVTASAGRRTLPAWVAAIWAAGTAEFAWARIAPGPRTLGEISRMVSTSIAIPPAATWHSLLGLVRHRGCDPWRGRPEAVLFDRDGTLIEDIPLNADPSLVRPRPGSREALTRLRSAGIKVGVVTNQAAIGRGQLSARDVEAVNHRVVELLGPFDTWQQCPHAPEDGCACRKPAPALITAACSELGVSSRRCVVVGDVGSDVEAALGAGAGAVLVPTRETRAREVRRAPNVAPDLSRAADLILGGAW
jgi:histidinol-phosphate phosphatase family protein